jgi:aspartate aminotransferase
MNEHISTRVNALAESETLAMARRSRELEAQGHNIIKLNIGEPDFQTPEHIKKAAKDAIDAGFSFYTPVSGTLELRQAIAEKLQRDNGLHWKAENIVVSTGAKQSIANILLTLLNPEDEVIVFTPYWVSYSEIIKLAEGKAVLIAGSPENGFKVTAEQLKQAITPKTRAVLYSAPCNPTGAIYTHEELEAIAKVIEPHPQIHVIADEIYEYICFEPTYTSIGSFDFIHDRVVTINGFSKGFAMTGWRVGYMAAHKDLALACDKLQGQVTSGTCSIAQKAATAALKDLMPTHEMRKIYQKRRDLIVGLLNEIPNVHTLVPQGAFYAFPDLSHYVGKAHNGKVIASDDELAMLLLTEAHVAMVQGSAFGAPNFMRISFAASEAHIREALKRLHDFLGKLV